MTHHHPHALHKYVPASPASPHQYDEDSFEAEELSRSHPQLPIPRNYELTFKKDVQQQYFMKQGRQVPQRTLFAGEDQSLLQQISAPLLEYHGWSLEELSSLPFADLMSMQLSEQLREKVNLLGEIVQVKRMRMKLGSVGVNLKCLRVKEQLPHEQKNRLFLLELLWKQLSKKIFLEALRLNLAQNKYLAQYSQIEQEMQNTINGSSSHRIQQQFLPQEEEEINQQYVSEQSGHFWPKQQEPDDEPDEDSQSHENLQQKLMIFTHATAPIFQKLLFFAFHRISQASLHPHPNAKSTFQHECESIPLISRPNIVDVTEEESRYKPNHEHEYEGEQELSQSRLEQLYSYIQALHEESAASEDIMRRYFIKWKIHLLESIAESILNQIKSNSMYRHHQLEETPPSERSLHHQDTEQEPQLQQIEEEENKDSRYTSQLSQDSSLKNQKRLLKEYLRNCAIRYFFSQLSQHNEARKISSICVQMRKGNILHKTFQALKENANEQKLARQMEDYYEDVANNQYQDDGTSKLFHKTNLLFTYFNKIKENYKNERMIRVLTRIVIKISFYTLKQFGVFQHKQSEMVGRFLNNARNCLMFKCFSGWKQVYLHQNCFNERFRLHMSMKEREMLQYYFSILKLEFKRSLLKERRADKYYAQKLVSKIFLSLKYLYQDSKQMSERAETLQNYLAFSRSSTFFRNFQQYYIDFTAYQRFYAKEEKLKRTLIRLHALEAIKHWRKAQIKKSAYEAIEMKLVRFKNKQRKREIFTKWLERTQRLLSRSSASNQSDSHKDWLVKYYGNLCSVLP